MRVLHKKSFAKFQGKLNLHFSGSCGRDCHAATENVHVSITIDPGNIIEEVERNEKTW